MQHFTTAGVCGLAIAVFLFVAFLFPPLLHVWIVQLPGLLCRRLHIFVGNKCLNALMDLSWATPGYFSSGLQDAASYVSIKTNMTTHSAGS